MPQQGMFPCPCAPLAVGEIFRFSLPLGLCTGCFLCSDHCFSPTSRSLFSVTFSESFPDPLLWLLCTSPLPVHLCQVTSCSPLETAVSRSHVSPHHGVGPTGTGAGSKALIGAGASAGARPEALQWMGCPCSAVVGAGVQSQLHSWEMPGVSGQGQNQAVV